MLVVTVIWDEFLRYKEFKLRNKKTCMVKCECKTCALHYRCFEVNGKFEEACGLCNYVDSAKPTKNCRNYKR